jgi:hypothetical protein
MDKKKILRYLLTFIIIFEIAMDCPYWIGYSSDNNSISKYLNIAYIYTFVVLNCNIIFYVLLLAYLIIISSDDDIGNNSNNNRHNDNESYDSGDSSNNHVVMKIIIILFSIIIACLQIIGIIVFTTPEVVSKKYLYMVICTNALVGITIILFGFIKLFLGFLSMLKYLQSFCKENQDSNIYDPTIYDHDLYNPNVYDSSIYIGNDSYSDDDIRHPLIGSRNIIV